MAAEPEVAPVLGPDDSYEVGPGPGLRLVLKRRPPSTTKDRFVAAILTLPAWMVAFPPSAAHMSAGRTGRIVLSTTLVMLLASVASLAIGANGCAVQAARGPTDSR